MPRLPKRLAPVSLRVILLSLLVALLAAACGGREPARPTSDETVLLLHGLARSAGSMEALADHLREAGYRVVNFDYPSTEHEPSTGREPGTEQELGTEVSGTDPSRPNPSETGTDPGIDPPEAGTPPGIDPAADTVRPVLDGVRGGAAGVRGSPAGEARDTRVLVVDDDPQVLDMLSRHLCKGGYRVLTAASGSEALQRAEAQRPAAITLDVMMPDLDGWAVLAQLKDNPELSDIPVIMLSILDDRRLGCSLGASDYLTKPVKQAAVDAMIQKWIPETSKRDENRPRKALGQST